MTKPKILYISDYAGIPFVGQSIVSRELMTRLTPYYDFVHYGFGMEDTKNPVKMPGEIKCFNCQRPDMGDVNKVSSWIDEHKPNMVFFSHDPWLFPTLAHVRGKYPDVKFMGWITVDGEPPYYKWREWLSPYDKIISPAHYGTKVLKDRWMDLNVGTVPYGINHKVFHPPKQGKDKLKIELYHASGGMLNMVNKFVSVYVGANQDRKNLGLQHEAWKAFEKGKEHNILHIMCTHSASLKEECGTYDLLVFIADTKSLFVIPEPQPLETIGQIMAASDILFHPSNGEGWGVTVGESLACGTVPVTTLYAGVTDFCNEENSYGIPYALHVGGFHVLRAFCGIPETVEVLNKAYNNREELKAKSEAGIKMAAQYTWENSAALMKKEIDEVLTYDSKALYVARIV